MIKVVPPGAGVGDAVGVGSGEGVGVGVGVGVGAAHVPVPPSVLPEIRKTSLPPFGNDSAITANT
jgi:hypothetical protein